jgi:Cof subfamily protein (haloacid dehalogenase superfamily)
MIRVVAVDLDGTLLRSDTTVSPRTVKALANAAEAGARIVAVTARPPRVVTEIAAEAGLTGTAICSNGAIVADLGSGVVEIVGPLPIDLARRTAAEIATFLPEAGFAVETGLRALIAPGYRHRATRDPLAARVQVDSLAQLWATAESCVKLLAWSPAPVTDELLAAFAGRLSDVEVTYSGGSGMVEVSAAGVTKVATLAALCAEWGVGPSDVIAFGDAQNDLSVLGWAGISVAMANAHPAVIAAADRVTASNDEDGVALVLEEFFD